MTHPEVTELNGMPNEQKPIGIPTGKSVRFGENNEFEIQVLMQPPGTELCGYVAVETFGYDLAKSKITITPDGLTYADVFVKLHAEDSAEDDPTLPHTPYLVLGTRTETGSNHWYILVNQTVIDPLTGTVNYAQTYRQTEITEVTAVFKLPFKGSTSILPKEE